MRQLFVLRHAKSSWDNPGLADHERPLAPRGRRAVKLLAKHLESRRIEPALVLCSSALRTRQTYDGVAAGGDLRIEPDLYGASAGDVLERLRRVSEDVPSVMVIGHNPALQLLVLKLGSEDGHGGHRAEVQHKFPTAALATLQFDCAWSELAPGCARIVDLVRPRDLH